MTSLNGVIVVNKPREFTSFDVVAVVRGCLHTKKVGHSGTLDPMATGVLPIFVGGATKAISLLPDHDKSYRAGFRLGITSDTLDIWGNCTELKSQENEKISAEILLETLGKFIGEIEQIPPMYSALKVNGQKLCDLARKGIEVERKPRRVTITRLELLSFDGRDGIIDVDCSSGTYIRSLVDDIGRELGVGAVMTALERTKACGFTLDESVSVEELRALGDEERLKLLKSVESVFSDFSVIRLDAAQQKLYFNGVRLDAGRLGGNPGEGVYRVYGDGFIGLARIENGELVPVKRFNGD